MVVPSGLAEIKDCYGDPFEGGLPTVEEPEGWRSKILTTIQLPETLPLSWDLSVNVSRISCHKVIAYQLSAILREIMEEGLWPRLRSYGGCYCWRATRGGTRLSTHSWGIAVDFAVATNQLGTPGDMDRGIVEIFEAAGWTWGGRWGRPDPMHFAAARDY